MKKVLCVLISAIMVLTLIPCYAFAEDVNVFATGYNRSRGENDLIIYTPIFGESTNTNIYGTEAVIDSNGKIVSVGNRGNSSIPENGFVISGHGKMASWVSANCAKGKYCAFNQYSLEITISNSPIEGGADLFYHIEKKIDGFNIGRDTNQVILYTKANSYTGTNEWGYEVVVENGRIVSMGGNNNRVPQNGFVISVHGSAHSWLGGVAKLGMMASYDQATRILTLSMDGESYLTSIDVQIQEFNNLYNKAKEDFLYCDYEYLDSVTERIKTLREGYSNLETEKQQCEAISELVTLVSNGIAACGESRPVEYRGIWVLPKQKTKQEVSDYVQKLYESGINLISLEAISNSTLICPVPKGSLFEHNPSLNGFDLLGAYVEECHSRGMELHLWMPVFSTTNSNDPNFKKSPWYKKKEWRSINNSGSDVPVIDSDSHRFLNPANPEVQDFLLETYRYILENYDIDGLELDYIRYQSKNGDDYGYDDITVNGFKEKYGITPKYNTAASFWDDWAQYRCDIITDFVGRLSQMKNEVAPDVLLSADVGTDAESSPLGTYQDFGAWVEKGYIDLLKPMSYSLESINKTHVNVELMDGKYLAAGVGAYDDKFDSLDVAIHTNIANQLGADGVVFFEAATFVGKNCTEFLLEHGPFRNSAVTPTYNVIASAEKMLDYTIGKIDNAILPLKGITEEKANLLKTEIASAKALVSTDMEAAIEQIDGILETLEDTKAEKSIEKELLYTVKLLKNYAKTIDTPKDDTADEASGEINGETNSETNSEIPEESQNNGFVWVIISGVLVLVALGAVLVVKKRKSK